MLLISCIFTFFFFPLGDFFLRGVIAGGGGIFFFLDSGINVLLSARIEFFVSCLFSQLCLTFLHPVSLVGRLISYT